MSTEVFSNGTAESGIRLNSFFYKGWRTDVDYSVPLQICDIHCGKY